METQDIKMSPVEVAKANCEKALTDVNAIIQNGGKEPINLTKYNEAMATLTKAEEEYANLAQLAMYDEYAKKENPIIEIVKAYSYDIIKHSEIKDKATGRVLAVEPTGKTMQVDLLKFCERAKLDTLWSYTASKFNQMMCLRCAKDLGIDCNKIAKSYYMSETAKKIDLGKTPTSNTQVCKVLQQVIDQMLPNRTDDDKVIYKVNNHDVAYIMDLYCRKSSQSKLTVKVANDSFFRRILFDIAHRLITNGKYDAEGYKIVKK